MDNPPQIRVAWCIGCVDQKSRRYYVTTHSDRDLDDYVLDQTLGHLKAEGPVFLNGRPWGRRVHRSQWYRDVRQPVSLSCWQWLALAVLWRESPSDVLADIEHRSCVDPRWIEIAAALAVEAEDVERFGPSLVVAMIKPALLQQIIDATREMSAGIDRFVQSMRKTAAITGAVSLFSVASDIAKGAAVLGRTSERQTDGPACSIVRGRDGAPEFGYEGLKE